MHVNDLALVRDACLDLNLHAIKYTSPICLIFRYEKGGYLFLPSNVMRIHGSRKQQEAMRKTPPQQMQKVFEVVT